MDKLNIKSNFLSCGKSFPPNQGLPESDPFDTILSPLNRPTDIPNLNTLFKRLSSQNSNSSESVQETSSKGSTKK
jgi:hypothetical protein